MRLNMTGGTWPEIAVWLFTHGKLDETDYIEQSSTFQNADLLTIGVFNFLKLELKCCMLCRFTINMMV